MSAENLDRPAWAVSVHDDLIDAAIGLDGDRIQFHMREVLAERGADGLVADVLVPLLRDIGDRWESGQLSVMHEHHASAIIRSVLAQMRPHDVSRDVPAVVLGCPPGELHDLPLHLFALMLSHRGMRPVLVAPNTPLSGVSHAIRANESRACVLVARRERLIVAYRSVLLRMGRNASIFIAGPASLSAQDAAAGLRPLSFDWRDAADTVLRSAVEQVGESAG